MSVTSLALVKEYLMISHSAQDNVIQMMIDGAEDFLKAELGIELASASYTENLPLANGPLDTSAWYVQPWMSTGDMHLTPTHQPCTAVASVTDLYNPDSDPYTFTLINGLIHWTDENGIPYGRWPQGVARFQVVYTAGLATVPAVITEAVCALVKRRYDSRSGETGTGASGATQTWSDFRDADFMKRVRTAFSRRLIAGF